MTARPAMRRAAAAVLAACALAAAAAELTRAQALRELASALPLQRAQAVERLGDIGTMADAERVAERLRDAHPGVREIAQGALWRIWSRSGSPEIDRLLRRGVDQMSAGELEAALATFDAIIRRKPEFAEGWNKRATVLFMLGRDNASLKDCDEVLKRNPRHFGALSGMTQIHLRRGDPAAALQAWERALQANPNLDGGAETLRILEEAVRARGGART